MTFNQWLTTVERLIGPRRILRDGLGYPWGTTSAWRRGITPAQFVVALANGR